MLQRFDGYRLPLAMKRIMLRHATKAASQRLMIENGDIGVARDLSPDDLDTLSKSGKIKATAVPQTTLMYLGLNNKNLNLAKPEVWEAMKWLTSIIRASREERNPYDLTRFTKRFCPKGSSARITRIPIY